MIIYMIQEDIKKAATHEKRQHSTTLVPYSYYQCCLPDFFINVPMHWHNEFEINYVFYGKGEFICGDEKFIACAGDILIIPPNMLHAAYPYQDHALFYDACVFNPNMLGTGSDDRCTIECIRPIINGTIKLPIPITLKSSYYEDIKQSADHIFTCAKKNRAQPDLLLKSELLRIFWILENNRRTLPPSEPAISHSEIIRPALAFMTENFRDAITIEQLAALVHLSKSYFMSCFKKAVGVGAVEHLTQLRIKASCEEIVHTNQAISEISLNCGYNNLSNFNRQFKRIVGCTPQEYRQKGKIDQPIFT